MKNKKRMNKKNMRSFLTLNNIKYLFNKWENYICLVLSVLFVIQVYSSISNFELKTVYAMEHMKQGIYYAKIQFDFKSLRNYILHNTQISENELKKILVQKKLDGLFDKGHIFLIYDNIKVLSSLTHSKGIDNIFLSDSDYRGNNRPQYLGELFDYKKNQFFLKIDSLFPKEKDKFVNYFGENEDSILEGLEKQQCQKPTIVVSDEIEKHKRKQ